MLTFILLSIFLIISTSFILNRWPHQVFTFLIKITGREEIIPLPHEIYFLTKGEQERVVTKPFLHYPKVQKMDRISLENIRLDYYIKESKMDLSVLIRLNQEERSFMKFRHDHGIDALNSTKFLTAFFKIELMKEMKLSSERNGNDYNSICKNLHQLSLEGFNIQSVYMQPST
jgi:hypothetical protein